MTTPTGPLLEVEQLAKHFAVSRGFLNREQAMVQAVDGVTFTIEPGTTLALVGESGCGKSTTARMILLLEQPTSGSIRFLGDDVTRMKGKALSTYKRSVQAVFQDPFSSLSPRMRVRDIVGEPLQIHEHLSRKQLALRVGELLEQVGLADRRRHRAGQLSGGEAQRVAVAVALAPRPRVLLADEPTGELDEKTTATVLDLLDELRAREGMAILTVTHNAQVAERADRRLTMRDGVIADA
jgi:ABC-type glutathione transport system ATPase component